MNRLAALLIFLSSPVLASNPFECVDPDFSSAFLDHWSQKRLTYSTTLPANFVPLDLPEELVLVGSLVSDSHMNVIFKSNERRSDVLASTLDALKEADWKLVDQQRGMPRGGFQMSTQPTARVVCRDSKPGVMNIMARDVSGQSMVSFSIYAHQLAQTCDDLNQETRARHSTPLMEYMPNLNLPSGTKTTNMGMGGSGDEMSSRVVVSTTRSREELLGYLGDQIGNQNWLLDTGWSGSVSSGTVWSMSSEKDGEILGVLRITQAANEVFNIRFSVSPITTNQNAFNVGSFSSSSH